MAFGGFVAMFLFLPKLLTGVHDLSKPDAGYRAAGFARWPSSAVRSAAGCRTASVRATC